MTRILAIEHPELVLEWSENNIISPMDISSGSHKKVWWRGKCGHEWEAVIKNRVYGAGCPYCSGNKVLVGFNDLATIHPELTEEWADDNYPLLPEHFASNSNKEIIWRCSNGHKWKARIADRSKGHGCPRCATNNTISRTLFRLFEEESSLSELWSERNDISIKDSPGGPRRVYWWKCRNCGDDFRASVGFMVKGAVCPACRKEASDYYKELVAKRNRGNSPRFRLPSKAFEYYASLVGLQYTKDDDSLIGIPFQYFLPKYRAAIEFSKQHYYLKQFRRNNGVMNDLCLRTQIKMIRILESAEENYDDCFCISRLDDSYEGITEALLALFGLLRIDIDIDVERDMVHII